MYVYVCVCMCMSTSPLRAIASLSGLQETLANLAVVASFDDRYLLLSSYGIVKVSFLGVACMITYAAGHKSLRLHSINALLCV